MRAVLLRSLLVIAAGGLVLAGLLYVASTVDGRPPAVVDVALTQPLADDADRALITTSIEISFSEPVDLETATDAISLLPAVDNTLSQSGSTLIFTPAEPLDLETEYALVIGAGIRDGAGNDMTDVPDPYEFVTAGRPALADSDPADGETDVPPDGVIRLSFTGLMDTASVEEALELSPAVEYAARWSGELLEIQPVEPLEPGSDYSVRIGDTATDVAGVRLGEPVSIAFRTLSPGLAVESVVPADGSGGVSPQSQVAVAFDGALDPESVVSEVLTLTPSVGGTVDVVEGSGDAAGPQMLTFTPSSPLPPNTTFEVRLSTDLRTPAGGALAEPLTWSFTTGAPQATLSNQVLFISDRGGVANVWAMNPDGTGQHQVSAELAPVLDYAAAPDGSSIVVGDGRRLVHMRADGSGRRVLTDAAHLEFDATYAPDGSRIAFARAAAATGAGLGLWEWEVGGGAATRIEMPAEPGSSATPTPSAADATLLRSPSYSPDGRALAFVDPAGTIGILDVEEDALAVVDASAAGRPVWDGRGGTLLVPLGDASGATRLQAPVEPLAGDGATDVGLVRSPTQRVEDAPFGPVRHVVTGADGRVGWVDDVGRAHVSERLGDDGTVPDALADATVAELAFGPTDDVVLAVLGEEDEGRRIDRVDLVSGQRTALTNNGWQVRWLP